MGSSRGVLSIAHSAGSACSRAGMRGPVPWKQPTCGARRSTTRGGTIFLCSIQRPRPTRGRPGYTKSYPNPSVTNGKPSRRPAVTAHMPHVPPERPNLHSRSATASERLGFLLATDGFRMLYVPPTGGRYSLGCPPSQQKLLKTTEAYRASAPSSAPTSKVVNYALGGGKTATAVIFSAGKAPAGWLKEPAAGLGYKQKTWTRRHQNG